jgi:F-type H+-transporting ATPase subunit g
MALNLIAKAPAMLVRSAQPQMANFARLAKVELVPSADVGGMLKGVGSLAKDALTFKWAQASMKDVAVNTVVVVEIACWFFIGECVGKGSLVGYQV